MAGGQYIGHAAQHSTHHIISAQNLTPSFLFFIETVVEFDMKMGFLGAERLLGAEGGYPQNSF